MTRLDINPPEDRQSFIELYRAFRDSGRAEFDSAAALRHRKADGSDGLVHVFGRRLNYDGRRALLRSLVDVTERLQAEAERDRTRQLVERIVERLTLTA